MQSIENLHPNRLFSSIAEALVRVIGEASPPTKEIAESLALSPRVELGEVSFPCFVLAKALKQPPPKIAAELAARWNAQDPSPLVTRARAAGPYLNFDIAGAEAAKLVLSPWGRGERPFFPRTSQRVMVEFSQPNTHKPFHVGHMRNVAVGACLVELLRCTGNDVVAANYLGDIGTHVARCLWGYYELLSDEERRAPDSARGEWLGGIYSRAVAELERLTGLAKAGDASAQARLDAAKSMITSILKGIEARSGEYYEFWRVSRQWSIAEFNEIYAWLGVRFDKVFCESDVDELSMQLVDEYLAKGVFKADDGAVGIENPEIKHMPFFLLRKTDGTGLYSSKDLALARLKFEEFRIDRSIYVVDVRQSDHFRHVFLTLEKMGFVQAKQSRHVPYETVELPEGPMSTRDGTVVLFRKLKDALDETLSSEMYLGRHVADWSPEELEAAIRALGVGAIKYGMLNRDLNQKIVFELGEWLSPEGNTGTYLQYTVARAGSILRKAKERDKSLLPGAELESTTLGHVAEHAVLLAIAGLPAAVAQAARELRPALLCAHLRGLAQAYNTFQNHRDCNVIQSEGSTLQSRLLLVAAAREALVWGLSLLGISAPDRV